MSLARTADVLVVGGGVVGLTAALALRTQHPDSSVVLLEKEAFCGAHASGRNSGVLHAGFYYSADSLKARFSVEGCRRMKELCVERGLPLRTCGKLVVAQRPSDVAQIDELLARGRRNGVDVVRVDEDEARAIEPRARTHTAALWSPSTASVDPEAVMRSLSNRAREVGVAVHTSTAYLGREGRVVRTSRGPVDAGFVLNCAGLQADAVARDFGFGEHLRVLPFRGLYVEGSPAAGTLSCHVYPVPDLEVPFLGVHLTVAVDGHLKIGPTALPGLWLEHYQGTRGFSAVELARVARLGLPLLATDRRLRALARRELAKTSRRELVRRSRGLIPDLRAEHWRTWGRPGVRAQLVDVRRRALVMDFLTEGDGHSLHVLNAVSPAFTCSLPFADHLADLVEAA